MVFSIPLLPRQQLPDPSEEKGTKKKGGGAAAVPIAGLMSLSGQDMDEQLINHVYNQGLTFLHSLVSSDLIGAIWLVESFMFGCVCRPMLK